MSLHTWGDYKIELYDKDRVQINDNLLEDAIGLRWKRRLYGARGGEFSFSIPLDSPGGKQVQQQTHHFVRIWRAGVCLMDGYFMKPSWKRSGRKENMLEVHGVPLSHIAMWRRGVPEVVGEPLKTTAKVDDAFKWFANHVLGANAPIVQGGASRAIPDFIEDADAGGYPVNVSMVCHASPEQTFFDWLEFYGVKYKVDWDIRFNDDMEMVFYAWYPRRGLDRTETNGVREPVIMNDAAEENLRGWSFYWDSGEMRTVVIASNLLEEVEDAALTAAWLRRETISKSSSDPIIEGELAKAALKEGYALEFRETVDCQYLTHFSEGDRVTVNNVQESYGPFDWPIAGVLGQILRDGQEELGIEFGDPEPDLLDKQGGGEGFPLPVESGPYALRDEADVMALFADDGTVPVIGDETYHTTKVSATVNGETVDAIQISGPWTRIATGDEYLRPTAYGDALRLYDDAQGLAFTITGDGDVIGNIQNAGGNADRYMNIADYDIANAANGDESGVHNIIFSGNLRSDPATTASYIDFLGGTNAEDQVRLRNWNAYSDTGGTALRARYDITNGLQLLDAATATVFQVDPSAGHTTWKVAAQMTWEAIPYRMPTSAPAAAGYILGYLSGTAPYQLAWTQPTAAILGNGTAQYQVPMTGASPFTPAWHTTTVTSAANSIPRTDANGYLRATRLEVGGNTVYLFNSSGALRSESAVGHSWTISGAVELNVDATGIYRGSSSTGTVGLSTRRWPNVYSVLGNFSGDVTLADGSDILWGSDTNLYRSAANVLKTDDSLTVIGDLSLPTAGTGIIASNNTSGYVLMANGTRYVPSAISKASLPQHAHNFNKATSTGTFTPGAFRSWIPVYQTQSTGSTVIGYVEGVEHTHVNATYAWTYTDTNTGNTII